MVLRFATKFATRGARRMSRDKLYTRDMLWHTISRTEPFSERNAKVSGKEGSSRQVRLSLRSTKKTTFCLLFLFTGYSFHVLAVLPRSGLFMAPQPLHPSPSLCTGGRSTSTLAFRPRVIFPLLPLQSQSLLKMNPVPTRSHLFLIKPRSNCDLVPSNP